MFVPAPMRSRSECRFRRLGFQRTPFLCCFRFCVPDSRAELRKQNAHPKSRLSSSVCRLELRSLEEGGPAHVMPSSASAQQRNRLNTSISDDPELQVVSCDILKPSGIQRSDVHGLSLWDMILSSAACNGSAVWTRRLRGVGGPPAKAMDNTSHRVVYICSSRSAPRPFDYLIAAKSIQSGKMDCDLLPSETSTK